MKRYTTGEKPAAGDTVRMIHHEHHTIPFGAICKVSCRHYSGAIWVMPIDKELQEKVNKAYSGRYPNNLPFLNPYEVELLPDYEP